MTGFSASIEDKVLMTFPDQINDVNWDIIGCTPIYTEQEEIERASELCNVTSVALESIAGSLSGPGTCVQPDTVTTLRT